MTSPDFSLPLAFPQAPVLHVPPITPDMIPALGPGAIEGDFVMHGRCPGYERWTLEIPYGESITMADVEEVLVEHARQCPGLTRICLERAIPIY